MIKWDAAGGLRGEIPLALPGNHIKNNSRVFFKNCIKNKYRQRRLKQ
jgi:hypothetical protein